MLEGKRASKSKSAIHTLIEKSAAKSTWDLRKRVFKIFVGEKMSTTGAITAILQGQQQPKTKAKYLSALSWITDRHNGNDVPTARLFRDLGSGLRRTRGPSTRKALPASRGLVQGLLKSKTTSQDTKAVAVMAFVTASRVDEVMRVTRTSSDGDGLLQIFTNSKTNPEGLPRIDHLTMITKKATKWVKVFNKRREKIKLSKVRRELKRFEIPQGYLQKFQAMDPRASLIPHLTFHSFKRGAAYHLWKAAAKKLILPEQVAQALKHVSQDSSLGYAPNPKTVAKAFQKDTVAAILTI